VNIDIRFVARSRPGAWVWPRVLICIILITIITVAAWVGYGPAAVITLLAGVGLAAARSITAASR